MVFPIGFAEANDIIGRPPGTTPEQCKSLEVYRDKHNIVSRWQLTDEDIDELKKNGGKIYLCIWGKETPPVMLSVLTPFEENK